jgi:hypothetical protein
MVFWKSPHRETPKNVINKNEKKSGLDFSSNALEKLFDMDILQKYVRGVFELPSPRNAKKRTKKKQGKKSRLAGGPGIYLQQIYGGVLFFLAAHLDTRHEARGTRHMCYVLVLLRFLLLPS